MVNAKEVTTNSVPTSWQRNLYVLFIAEFIVIMGFSFTNPFMALFIQQVGNYSNEEAAFWSAMSQAAHGIAMFVSGPFWGILADRWGRKPMVLRAMLGSAVVLALVGLAPNVYYITVLRAAQGLLSGTVAAASALVAALTPRNRLPFAMGLLMVAVFGGQTIGPLVGGFLADQMGYKVTFFITGGLLFLGGLIVLFFVKENFQRPPKGEGVSLGTVWRLAKSREILPLLAVLCALSAGPNLISPVLPIFFKGLEPAGAVATASGVAFALMGVVAAVSSGVASRLAGRVSLKKMLVFSCIGTGLMYLLPMAARSSAQLIMFVALTGLLKGGLMTASNALVGLSVSQAQHGIAYGISQSANSLGGGLGPLLSGALVPVLGLKPLFVVTFGLYGLIGLIAARLLPREIRDVTSKKE